MKKILFILFIIVSTIAYSEELSGVYGLTFGSSFQEVKEALKAKSVKIVGEENEAINFTGAFNGRDFSIGQASFKNGKLSEVSFLYSGFDEVHYRERFDILVDDVNSKYPNVQAGDCSKFVEPFSAGDGFEVTALKSGHGILKHAWFFSSGRQIVVSVGRELLIFVSFQAYDIMNENQNGEKQLSDF